MNLILIINKKTVNERNLALINDLKNWGFWSIAMVVLSTQAYIGEGCLGGNWNTQTMSKFVKNICYGSQHYSSTT